MAEPPYDVAIFGSTPLAGLLAGLLATAHRRRVVLVGQPVSPLHLPQGIDLSVQPATRPETWALLKASTAETLRLLHHLGGRAAIRHIDAVFLAGTDAGSEALSHMNNMARGFDFAVERLAGAAPGTAGFRLRDAVLLRSDRLQPALAGWLQRSGVGRLDMPQSPSTLHRDGSVRIATNGGIVEAAHAVLADDAGILATLDAAELDRTVRLEETTALLTEPTRPMLAPLVRHIDCGVTLLRNRTGGIFALAAGGPEAALPRIGGCLLAHGSVRRIGQRTFRSIATADGAPLFGPSRTFALTILAGLGQSGAFLAPALARHIAGVAEPAEAAFFAARTAGRPADRALVADFAAAAPVGVR